MSRLRNPSALGSCMSDWSPQISSRVNKLVNVLCFYETNCDIESNARNWPGEQPRSCIIAINDN